MQRVAAFFLAILTTSFAFVAKAGTSFWADFVRGDACKVALLNNAHWCSVAVARRQFLCFGSLCV